MGRSRRHRRSGCRSSGSPGGGRGSGPVASASRSAAPALDSAGYSPANTGECSPTSLGGRLPRTSGKPSPPCSPEEPLPADFGGSTLMTTKESSPMPAGASAPTSIGALAPPSSRPRDPERAVTPEARGEDGREPCKDRLRAGKTVTTIAAAAISASMRTSVFTSGPAVRSQRSLAAGAYAAATG